MPQWNPNGADPGIIASDRGEAYLAEKFPRMDRFVRCVIDDAPTTPPLVWRNAAVVAAQGGAAALPFSGASKANGGGNVDGAAPIVDERRAFEEMRTAFVIVLCTVVFCAISIYVVYGRWQRAQRRKQF